MNAHGFLKAVGSFLRKNAAALLVALAVAFLLAAYAFRAALFPAPPSAAQTSRPRATPGVPTLRDPLTGFPVPSAQPLPRVYGVMVDNMVDALPQSGLDQAPLVIEAPVEAGIPRLLAFFSSEPSVQKIGPIRSARPYFIDWDDELDALYAHVGGSDEALADLSAGGTFDFNQFWNGSSFWRSTDRQAPHNVYTSTQLLSAAWDRLAAQGKAPAPSYGIWMFKDPAVLPPDHPASPSIDFSMPDYRVSWLYDAKTDQYRRWQGGLPDTMQDGSAIAADNVAVVATKIETVDQIGHRHITTIGSGDALVFQDGGVIKATWKKPSARERLRFFDGNGTEVQMNSGKTWIEVVPGLDAVTYDGKD